MKKTKGNNILLKLNITFTFLTIFVGIIIFKLTNFETNNIIAVNSYQNGILFFSYLLILHQICKKNEKEAKEEAMQINYAAYVGFFLLLMILLFIGSVCFLYKINPNALNLTFIFTFFINLISTLFPSIFMFVFIFLIAPFFLVNNADKYIHKRNHIFCFKIISVFLIIFCFFKLFTTITKDKNDPSELKKEKLAIEYQTSFLNLNEIHPYTKKLLTKNEVKIPFFYTSTGKKINTYTKAKEYCKSINGRLPNHLEAYHIVFNKFNTIGEEHYWTSDKENGHPLILQFKNMSYKITKKQEDKTPVAYCIEDNSHNTEQKEQILEVINYENKKLESINTKSKIVQDFSTETQNNYSSYSDISDFASYETRINSEKKYVNFSVKEVTDEILNDLIKKGYKYDKKISLRKEYETNNKVFLKKIRKYSNEIKLCYYPFTEYINMSIDEEMQIWEQSFCSPAFKVIKQTPELKTIYEKENYCSSNEGRLPNIPELNGIIKTLGTYTYNTYFWTNNKLNDNQDIIVKYKDENFMNVEKISKENNQSAYTFCITETKEPSQIIANYKSRFNFVSGTPYAKKLCPDCYYYEMPDVILQQ